MSPNTIFLRCCLSPLLRFAVQDRGGLLGRSSRCCFVVNDPTVSRRHARLEVHYSDLLVTDLGSRNGTFFNEERVQACRVVPGQVIQFGKISFQTATTAFEDNHLDSEVETDRKGLGSKGLGSRNLKSPARVTQVLLSEAQQRVFEVLLSGLPEKTIARRLHLSTHTVHNHIRAIFRHFGVHSRAELLAKHLGS